MHYHNKKRLQTKRLKPLKCWSTTLFNWSGRATNSACVFSLQKEWGGEAVCKRDANRNKDRLWMTNEGQKQRDPFIWTMIRQPGKPWRASLMPVIVYKWFCGLESHGTQHLHLNTPVLYLHTKRTHIDIQEKLFSITTLPYSILFTVAANLKHYQGNLLYKCCCEADLLLIRPSLTH